MVLWPALTLVGFLMITAVVVLLGLHSTARYERERRVAAERPGRARHAAGEVLGATAVL